MMESNIGNSLWSALVFAGPIILALAIVLAMARNRRTRAEKDRTERAVREQHDEERRKEGLEPGGTR